MGKPKGEGAQMTRFRRRREAAMIREDFALQLFARGLSYPQIAEGIRLEYGSCALSTAHDLVQRGLARRAVMREQDEEATAKAKEKYLVYLEKMLSAYMPRALGGEDADGNVIPPNERAGTLLLGVLDRMAEVEGVKSRPELHNHETNINLHVGGHRDEAIDRTLQALRAESVKQRVVEGHLADVGTSTAEATDGRDVGDNLPPPPRALPAGVRAIEGEAA